MNSLTTDAFCATRQESGDVWIQARRLSKWELGLIIIPKEDCMELARLLMWPVISESHKVDYTLSVNEPE